jgi:hypothetical protein
MHSSYHLLFTWWLMLLLPAQGLHAQNYRAESTDPAQPFLCRLVLQRDSTFSITYQTLHNSLFLEHRGCCMRIKDSLYCLESLAPLEVRIAKPPSPPKWYLPKLTEGYKASWKLQTHGRYTPNLWKPLNAVIDLPRKHDGITLRIEAENGNRHLELELNKGQQLSVELGAPQEMEWVIKPQYAQTAGDGLPHGGGLILFQHAPKKKSHATTGKKHQRKIIKGKHPKIQSRVKQVPAPPRR